MPEIVSNSLKTFNFANSSLSERNSIREFLWTLGELPLCETPLVTLLRTGSLVQATLAASYRKLARCYKPGYSLTSLGKSISAVAAVCNLCNLGSLNHRSDSPGTNGKSYKSGSLFMIGQKPCHKKSGISPDCQFLTSGTLQLPNFREFYRGKQLNKRFTFWSGRTRKSQRKLFLATCLAMPSRRAWIYDMRISH